MKVLVFSLLLLCFSLGALAQKTDTITSPKHRFYAGFGLNSIRLQMHYKEEAPVGPVRLGYFRSIFLNVGYALSRRATLQLGLAYGGDKDEREWERSMQQNMKVESRTQVMAIPVTMRLIVGNTHTRMPVYATFTLMPTFGKTTSKLLERDNNIITNTTITKKEGLNTFATAGVGFNYKIWQRFTGFGELLFLKSNLFLITSDYYTSAPRYITFTSAFGLGVNYNF